MAFFFPFSTLHELNLDWIMDRVKTLWEQAEDNNNKADYAVETADEAKTIAEQAAQGQIGDGSVTTVKLADGAVTNIKLAANAVESGNIKDGEVKTSDIADGAVNTTKLAASAVTTAKIDNEAVTKSKLDSSFIGTGSFDTTSQTVIGAVNELDGNIDNAINAITNLDRAFKEFHFYYNSVSVSGGNSGTVFPNNIASLPESYVVLGVRGIWTGAGNIVVRGYVAETGEINYTSTTSETQTITANMLVLCLDTAELSNFF